MSVDPGNYLPRPPTGRVEDWRGGLRDWGVAVAGGFRPLPVPQSVP
jgi:hypothetical protein